MQHRHLNHERFTLAAIDDMIARGKWTDWAALRRAALNERAVLEKIVRICVHQTRDPTAQRHHFWMHWCNHHASAARQLGDAS